MVGSLNSRERTKGKESWYISDIYFFFGNTDQTWRFLDKQIKEKEVLSLMSRFWGGYKVF